MRPKVLNLLLVAAFVTAGCGGGSGPSVGTPSDAKQAGDVAAAVGSPTRTGTGKVITARMKKKQEGMHTAPAGTTD
jgi:hypothetical protein